MTKIKKVESMMPKPVALINIDRSDLNETHVKLLNYFVWRHHRGLEINPGLEEIADKRGVSTRQLMFDFENPERKDVPYYVTSLSEIAAAIGYKGRNMKKLKEDIMSLAEKAMRYNIFHHDADRERLKCVVTGAMTYLDHVRMEYEGRNVMVMFTLGGAFQAMLEEMKSKGSAVRYVWLDMQVLSRFSSKYAVALYELLGSYTNGHGRNRWELNGAFRDYFGIPEKTFRSTKVLNRDVFKKMAAKYEEATGRKVTCKVTKERGKRYVQIDVEEKKDADRDLFLFIAEDLGADKPHAYAHTLLTKYRDGESLSVDVSEYRRRFRQKAKEEKMKCEREEIMKRIRREYMERFGSGLVHINSVNLGVVPLDDAVRIDPGIADGLVRMYREHGTKIFGKVLVAQPEKGGKREKGDEG